MIGGPSVACLSAQPPPPPVSGFFCPGRKDTVPANPQHSRLETLTFFLPLVPSESTKEPSWGAEVGVAAPEHQLWPGLRSYHWLGLGQSVLMTPAVAGHGQSHQEECAGHMTLSSCPRSPRGWGDTRSLKSGEGVGSPGRGRAGGIASEVAGRAREGLG